MDSNSFENRKVWDFPTRLFHWLLAIAVFAGYYLGDNLSFSNYKWHFWLGYGVGGLIVFRILWGFIGSTASRFASFFPTPRRIFAYLPEMTKRAPSGEAGHSALGALSVFALLGALAVQVITGLLTYSDEIFAGGPLADSVSTQIQLQAGSIHHIMGDLLFYLVLLHLAAIAFYYFWKKENLIKPMITGWKWVRK